MGVFGRIVLGPLEPIGPKMQNLIRTEVRCSAKSYHEEPQNRKGCNRTIVWQEKRRIEVLASLLTYNVEPELSKAFGASSENADLSR